MFTYKGYTVTKSPGGWWAVRDPGGRKVIEMFGSRREVRKAIDQHRLNAYPPEESTAPLVKAGGPYDPYACEVQHESG